MIALILAAALYGPRPGHVCTINPTTVSDCDFESLKGVPPKGYIEVPASAVHCHPKSASVSSIGGSVGDMKFETSADLVAASACGTEIGHVWIRKEGMYPSDVKFKIVYNINLPSP